MAKSGADDCRAAYVSRESEWAGAGQSEATKCQKQSQKKTKKTPKTRPDHVTDILCRSPFPFRLSSSLVPFFIFIFTRSTSDFASPTRGLFETLTGRVNRHSFRCCPPRFPSFVCLFPQFNSSRSFAACALSTPYTNLKLRHIAIVIPIPSVPFCRLPSHTPSK